jgi:hypothetical protein
LFASDFVWATGENNRWNTRTIGSIHDANSIDSALKHDSGASGRGGVKKEIWIPVDRFVGRSAIRCISKNFADFHGLPRLLSAASHEGI